MNSQVLPNLANQQKGDSYRVSVLPCHDIVVSGQPYGVASQSHPTVNYLMPKLPIESVQHGSLILTEILFLKTYNHSV